MKRHKPTGYPATGFTLIELMVVIAIIGALAGLLLPAVMRGKARAQSARCISNLRQLHLANTSYATDLGYYVAAAADIFGSNMERWHGGRQSSDQPFEASKGPLASYLLDDGETRQCPAFARHKRRQQGANAFEEGCGGYGYNDRGVGSRIYAHGFGDKASAYGMVMESIARPTLTVMFCDTAFPQPYYDPEYLIEYSFAESYHFVMGYPPEESGAIAQPSIHFRHLGKANVVWCDGHVSSEEMTRSRSDNFEKSGIGWFGPPDNSLFDPY